MPTSAWYTNSDTASWTNTNANILHFVYSVYIYLHFILPTMLFVIFHQKKRRMLRSCHNIIILPCLELWHHLIHFLLQQYHYWTELNLMLYQKLSQNTIFYSQVSINPFSHLKLNIFEPLWNPYLFLINFHLSKANCALLVDWITHLCLFEVLFEVMFEVSHSKESNSTRSEWWATWY